MYKSYIPAEGLMVRLKYDPSLYPIIIMILLYKVQFKWSVITLNSAWIKYYCSIQRINMKKFECWPSIWKFIIKCLMSFQWYLQKCHEPIVNNLLHLTYIGPKNLLIALFCKAYMDKTAKVDVVGYRFHLNKAFCH